MQNFVCSHAGLVTQKAQEEMKKHLPDLETVILKTKTGPSIGHSHSPATSQGRKLGMIPYITLLPPSHHSFPVPLA